MHARLGAAEAGATKAGADISARSVRTARKVRIATPNPKDNQLFLPGQPSPQCAGVFARLARGTETTL